MHTCFPRRAAAQSGQLQRYGIQDICTCYIRTTIADGKNTYIYNIYIHRCLPRRAAARSGQLHSGDVVLQVRRNVGGVWAYHDTAGSACIYSVCMCAFLVYKIYLFCMHVLCMYMYRYVFCVSDVLVIYIYIYAYVLQVRRSVRGICAGHYTEGKACLCCICIRISYAYRMCICTYVYVMYVNVVVMRVRLLCSLCICVQR